MATVLIQNGAIAGAAAAILAGRASVSADPAGSENALDANVAAAFGARFLTANAALAVPMADADNANIFLVCFGAAYGVMAGRAARSVVAADYAVQAAAAAALAKALVPKLA